jgi:hypothetical protein
MPADLYTTAAATWGSIHAIFSVQNHVGVSHLRCQIHTLRKQDMTMIRPFCITILYHNLLLFIDIFRI